MHQPADPTRPAVSDTLVAFFQQLKALADQLDAAEADH